MSSKKILALVLGLFIVLSVVLLIFRYQFASWAVQNYFAQKNIQIKFELNNLSLSAVSLSDIVIEDSLRLDELEVGLKSFSMNVENISSIRLKMPVFDQEKVMNVSSKLMGDNDKKKKPVFEALKSICQLIQDYDLDIQIDDIFQYDQKIPVGLKVSHKAMSTQTEIQVKGEMHASPRPESFILDDLIYDLAFTLDCSTEDIVAKVEKLNLILNKVRMENEVYIHAGKFDFNQGFVSLNSEGSIDVSGKLSIDMNVDRSEEKIFLGKSLMDLKLQTQLSDLSSLKVKLKSDMFETEEPLKSQVSQADLSLSFQKKPQVSLKGDYDIKGLNYIGTDGKSLVTGVRLEGEFGTKEHHYESLLKITDEYDVLKLNKTQLFYYPDNKRFVVQFSKMENSINLSGDMMSLSPTYSHAELSGKGSLNLSGKMGLLKNKWRGKLSIGGKNIDIESKFGKVKNLHIRHNVLEYPGLSTTSQRFIKADEVSYGPTVKDLLVTYQIKSLSNIKVKNMKVSYDGAHFSTSPFVTDFKNKKLSAFKVNIDHLPLKNVLQMGLGESAQAEGFLEGEVNVDFHKNNKPILKGRLVSPKKGRIQYRKPGQGPKDFSLISTNPMDILESYLYDFYYKNLDLDLESNEKYDMKMMLHTLGHNPQYLDGQKLKLNVNLEQNLLAAFKAMMLTYNLPNKLKGKIESMGEK